MSDKETPHKVTKGWLQRMSDSPTLDRKGPWLLKYESSDTRIWINELNKKVQARRERMYRKNWVLESQLVNRVWVNVDE